MSMRAVLYNGPEKGVSIGTVPKPSPKAGDILVKMAAAGLCHSDFEILDNRLPVQEYPFIPGHEATGIVESVGEGVTKFKPGDRVGFLMFYHPCGTCANCATAPLTCKDGLVQGFTTNGYFAEYAAVDANSAMILPSGLDVVEAAPLFCAGLTAYHAVDAIALKPGQVLGIVGLGGLGHLALQYALKRGMRVIGLDIDDKKLEYATKLGAEAVFNTRDSSSSDRLREFTNGGLDVAAVFSAAMAAYDFSVSVIRPGGTLVVVGLPEGRLPIYGTALATGLIHVKGASSGIPGPPMEKAIDYSAKQKILPHITKYQLEDFPEMVDKMRRGDFEGRMVVVF